MIVVKVLAAAVAMMLMSTMGLMVLVLAVVGGSIEKVAEATAVVTDASEEALADIPLAVLTLYQDAALACNGLPWPVLAGIAKVESDHGRFGGARIDLDGNVSPPIIGIPLDGTGGTAVMVDTDDGVMDGDTTYDRAVGPFQFLPSSWDLYGGDGNGDGLSDPHNMADAVGAAVRHLCPDGSVTDLEAAVFSYNRSTDYVAKVLDWADRYTANVTAISVAGYALPVHGLDLVQAVRPHHDYPAADVGVPVGTPTFAMAQGTVETAIGAAGIYGGGSTGKCGNTVVIAGIDSVRYTYCHLSVVTVTAGQQVVAGQQIGLTGGQPGTPGAGNTTGPHLHLSMAAGGRRLCPQPVFVSIINQVPINPVSAPSNGCVQGQLATDWPLWVTTQPQPT